MASKDEQDSRKLRKAVKSQASAASCKRQRKSAAALRSDVPAHETSHGTEDSASELSSGQLSQGPQRRSAVRLLKAQPKIRPKLTTRFAKTTATPWRAVEDMEQPQVKKRKGALRSRRLRKTCAPGTIEPEDTSASMAPLASSSKKESVHPRGHDTGKA